MSSKPSSRFGGPTGKPRFSELRHELSQSMDQTGGPRVLLPGGSLLPAGSAAQDLNAVFSDPRHQRATELMRAGRYAQAEEVLEASLKDRPAPDGYGLLGYARERQNKFAAAEKAYRESMRLDADFLFARVRLGIVLPAFPKHSFIFAWPT